MNLLQQFMADCNTQARDIVQELVELNGAQVYGTFGDPQLMPVMTGTGYQDHLVTPFKVSADQFGGGSPPAARQSLTRASNQRSYFIQIVDYTNPVVFTFLLTDREL